MLLYLHLIAFCLHFASGIGSIFLHIKNAKSDILNPSHKYSWGSDYEVNTETTRVTEIHAISVITLNEFITCFSHGVGIYYLYVMKLKNTKVINSYELFRRTYEYLITAWLLQCAIILHAGDAFLHDIVILFICNLVIQFTGVSIDMFRQSKTMGKREKEMAVTWSFRMSFALLTAQFFYVFTHCLNFESVKSRTFEVVMVFLYAVLYVCFGIVKYIENEMKANKIYIALSVTTKVVLSYIIIGATHMSYLKLDFGITYEGVLDYDWEAILVVGSLLLVGGGTFLTYIIYNEKEEKKRRDI